MCAVSWLKFLTPSCDSSQQDCYKWAPLSRETSSLVQLALRFYRDFSRDVQDGARRLSRSDWDPPARLQRAWGVSEFSSPGSRRRALLRGTLVPLIGGHKTGKARILPKPQENLGFGPTIPQNLGTDKVVPRAAARPLFFIISLSWRSKTFQERS